MVPNRTHTALNQFGLAAVSFRLVFTLFNAHSICWRRRWCLLGRAIQVNCPCSDRGAWNVTCISHCLASFSPSGGMGSGSFAPRSFAPRSFAPRSFAPRSFAPRSFALMVNCPLVICPHLYYVRVMVVVGRSDLGVD